MSTATIQPATREDILNDNDMVIEAVVVPEWKNRTIYVRSLSAGERDSFEDSIMKERRTRGKNGRVTTERVVDPKRIRAKLAVIACCNGDDDPTPFFKPSDVEALAKKNGAALDRIYDVAARLAGITDADVDELVKKSGETTTIGES
jgi:hypothetical protein